MGEAIDKDPEKAVQATMRAQGGLISRAQARAAGLVDHDIRRRIRRNEWAQVHPGVYINHTGSLTWTRRAWAALLFCSPEGGGAALSHDWALRASDGPGRSHRRDSDPIYVAVARERTVRAPAGVVVRRTTRLGDAVQWNKHPPRVRIEEALIDVALQRRDEFGAIALLADGIQSRRTTATRLLESLAARPRVARRSFLEGVLRDLEAGACSALEQAYLDRVERRHALPDAHRQVRDSVRGTVYRDVLYEEQNLIVELDGRQFHDTCTTAGCIGELLAQRGWSGTIRRCPDCQRVDSQPPGDWESTRCA